MTCVVGLKHNGKVSIGADSLGSNTLMQKTVRLDEKVFKNGEMLFGFTNSFRMGQILRYSFILPDRIEGLSDMEYLVAHFVPSLIECYEVNGFLKKGEGLEYSGGQFLLGYRGNLYNIDEDFQVGIPAIDYDALGCGGDIALGSLHTTGKLDKTITPAKRITLALEASTEHSAGVAPPFNILTI
jgi:hypothetical protein